MRDRFDVLGQQEVGNDTRLVGRCVVLMQQETAVGQPGTLLLECWEQLLLQQVLVIVASDRGLFWHWMGQGDAFLVPEDDLRDLLRGVALAKLLRRWRVNVFPLHRLPLRLRHE